MDVRAGRARPGRRERSVAVGTAGSSPTRYGVGRCRSRCALHPARAGARRRRLLADPRHGRTVRGHQRRPAVRLRAVAGARAGDPRRGARARSGAARRRRGGRRLPHAARGLRRVPGGPGGGPHLVDRRDADAGRRRVAPRRRRIAQLGGRPAPARPRSHQAVPGAQPRGTRRGSPAHVPRGRRLRGDRRRRRDRPRRDRRRRDAVHAETADGADAAAHLLRRDRAARADQRHLPPLPPGRSQRAPHRHLHRRARVGLDAAPRPGNLRGGDRQVVRHRAGRPEPRAVVAGPAGRRLPRRDPDQEPLRHAHLRAVRRRGRRHLAVPARPPAQHRGLRLDPPAEDARLARVQRGRRGRLRRRALLDQRDHRSRSADDRRAAPRCG